MIWIRESDSIPFEVKEERMRQFQCLSYAIQHRAGNTVLGSLVFLQLLIRNTDTSAQIYLTHIPISTDSSDPFAYTDIDWVRPLPASDKVVSCDP